MACRAIEAEWAEVWGPTLDSTQSSSALMYLYVVLLCHVSFKEPDLLLKSLHHQDPFLLLNCGEAEVTGTTAIQHFRAKAELDPRTLASSPGPDLLEHISDQ